jgi:hypothetical protein
MTKLSNRYSIILGVFLVATILSLSTIVAVNAVVPTVNDWSGRGAQAYFDIVHDQQHFIIDVLVAEQGLNPAGSNLFYLKVTHPFAPGGGTGSAELLVFNVPFTWTSLDSVSVTTVQTFTIGTTTAPHTITVTWTGTGPLTNGQFADKDGNPINAVGIWNKGTASISISHFIEGSPVNLGGTSTWAIIGLHAPAPDFVIPEVPLGTLVASVSMIFALIGFVALPKLKKRIL